MVIALLLLGLLAMVVGNIMVLIAAFKKSALWGLGAIVLAPVYLVFVILNWGQAKRGVAIQALGVLLFAGAVWQGAMSATEASYDAMERDQPASYAGDADPQADPMADEAPPLDDAEAQRLLRQWQDEAEATEHDLAQPAEIDPSWAPDTTEPPVPETDWNAGTDSASDQP
jgi:hypothetical protein